MKTFQQMDWINFVMLPMFLFSATFYPLSVYPRTIQWLIQAMPLWHGVELLRQISVGIFTPRHAGPSAVLPGHDRAGADPDHRPAAQAVPELSCTREQAPDRRVASGASRCGRSRRTWARGFERIGPCDLLAPSLLLSSAARQMPLKAGNISLAVLVLVFLVAVIFAANQNDVIGWIVVAVSLAWLVLAAFVVFSVRGATRKAKEKLASVQADYAGRVTLLPAAAPPSSMNKCSRANAVRDEKLDHSFKIIQVQAKVIRDYRGKDEGMVDRALETMEITAHNGRGMITRRGRRTVTGTVVS